MNILDEAYHQIQHFKGGSLRARIAQLESTIQGANRQSCVNFFATQHIDWSQLVAALLLKQATNQIDEVVHALGILLTLPDILDEGEIVEYVSLAAGNTGRLFDLETSTRIAEFKFTAWRGGPEAIRQNQFFKDFYLLAEYATTKERYLYFVGSAAPLKFLNSRRALSSVMSRNNKLWTTFQQQYGAQFTTVNQYYAYRAADVQLVDLAEVVPFFKQHVGQISSSEA